MRVERKRKLIEFIDDVGAEPKFIEVDDEAQDAAADEKDKEDSKASENQVDPRT